VAGASPRGAVGRPDWGAASGASWAVPVVRDLHADRVMGAHAWVAGLARRRARGDQPANGRTGVLSESTSPAVGSLT
jgi:hypothetical protein